MILSRQIAELLLKKKVGVDEVTKALSTYGLLSLLPNILNAVTRLTRDEKEQDTIRIESPFEIEESALARIKRIVGNDMAPTEVTINKNLLAGFKARHKGMSYDGSAARIIKQLTK